MNHGLRDEVQIVEKTLQLFDIYQNTDFVFKKQIKLVDMDILESDLHTKHKIINRSVSGLAKTFLCGGWGFLCVVVHF